ncbi:MAG TPA: hypothetical protein VGQ97_07670 [Xanthobacteraceae bacterium]|nr:hypothetical protein [Xanthobacteraceae bacterium]
MISARNLLLLALCAGWVVGLASQFHSARMTIAYLALSALMIAFAALRWPRREAKPVPVKPRRPDEQS